MSDFLAFLKGIEAPPVVGAASMPAPEPEPELADIAISTMYRYRFVVGIPFTRRMLEMATERWQQPLSNDDWADISKGAYLFEARELALQEYLWQWSGDNPEKLKELKRELFARDRLPRAAIPVRGEPGSKLR